MKEIKKDLLPQNENGEFIVGDIHGSFDELLLATQQGMAIEPEKVSKIHDDMDDRFSSLTSLNLPDATTLLKQDSNSFGSTGNHESLILKNINDLRQASFNPTDDNQNQPKNK